MWGRGMVMIRIMKLSLRILTCSEFSGYVGFVMFLSSTVWFLGTILILFHPENPDSGLCMIVFTQGLGLRLHNIKISMEMASFFLKFCGDSPNQEFPPTLSLTHLSFLPAAHLPLIPLPSNSYSFVYRDLFSLLCILNSS